MSPVLASLQAQTAFHREREAFHAKHEKTHREQRELHATELDGKATLGGAVREGKALGALKPGGRVGIASWPLSSKPVLRLNLTVGTESRTIG